MRKANFLFRLCFPLFSQWFEIQQKSPKLQLVVKWDLFNNFWTICNCVYWFFVLLRFSCNSSILAIALISLLCHGLSSHYQTTYFPYHVMISRHLSSSRRGFSNKAIHYICFLRMPTILSLTSIGPWLTRNSTVWPCLSYMLTPTSTTSIIGESFKLWPEREFVLLSPQIAPWLKVC